MAGWTSLSLQRIIADLRPSEVVVTEKIARISRLTLLEAEQPVGSIGAKGARLAIPGLVNLSDLAADTDGITKIVLESVQELLLKLALHMAQDDYETRGERQGCNWPSRLASIAGVWLTRPLSAHHCIAQCLPNSSANGRVVQLQSELGQTGMAMHLDALTNSGFYRNILPKYFGSYLRVVR